MELLSKQIDTRNIEMNPFKCGEDTASNSLANDEINGGEVSLKKEEFNGGEGCLNKEKIISGEETSLNQQSLDQNSTKDDCPSFENVPQSDFNGVVARLLNHYKNVEQFKRSTEMTVQGYMQFMPLYNEAMQLYAAKIALGKQEKTAKTGDTGQQQLEALIEKSDVELRIINQKLAALTDKINAHGKEYSMEESTPTQAKP